MPASHPTKKQSPDESLCVANKQPMGRSPSSRADELVQKGSFKRNCMLVILKGRIGSSVVVRKVQVSDQYSKHDGVLQAPQKDTGRGPLRSSTVEIFEGLGQQRVRKRRRRNATGRRPKRFEHPITALFAINFLVHNFCLGTTFTVFLCRPRARTKIWLSVKANSCDGSRSRILIPSEQFELAIYRWVKAVGLARSVNIPDFYNMPGSKGEYALVVDRLKDLHAHGYIGLFKINGNYRVPYEKFAPMEGENTFFGGGFTVEIAPGGRKFFEALEECEKNKETTNPTEQTLVSGPVGLDDIPRKADLLKRLQKSLDADELIAVLFLDLDGFKRVNDKLGHGEGDNFLKRVVEIIVEAIRGKGQLFRPGGDEFVVIFPNFMRHEAAATAERIRATIERTSPGGKLTVTVSIGVSDSESEASTDASALIGLADQAMYRAKKSAKNCVVVHDGFDGAKSSDAPDAIRAAIYGETSDLQPGTRVHVLVACNG